MINNNKIFLILLIAFFCFPLNNFAAEILQVRSSTQLQIGDRNRSYTVKLACIEVEPEYELLTTKWLKSNLQRRTRVNLKPEGISDGMLIARVIPIDSKIDLGESLHQQGLAKLSCL